MGTLSFVVEDGDVVGRNADVVLDCFLVLEVVDVDVDGPADGFLLEKGHYRML